MASEIIQLHAGVARQPIGYDVLFRSHDAKVTHPGPNKFSLLACMIQRINRSFHLEEWRADELESSDHELLQSAHRACSSAYSPYSKFNVGAAVRLASGIIVQGSNQENAAYPSGLCAERVAFFGAGAQHPGDSIVAAAVVTDRAMSVLDFSPCGGCRQVMLETEDRQGNAIRFLMQTGESNVLISADVSQFLPLSFKLPAHRNPLSVD